MANPTCRNCDRSADAGAYCSSCAAGIMANALNPPLPRPTQETSSRTRDTSAVARTHGRQLFRSAAPVRIVRIKRYQM